MEVGHHVYQGGVDAADPPGQGPGQLPGGVAGPLPAGGFQQIAHRLRLHQIQTAVKKGTAGELPWSGLSGPVGEEGLQPQREHHGGAVAVELSGVLTLSLIHI